MSEDADVNRLDAVWIRPREYEIGAASWQDRALDDLSRAIHPILQAMTRETVRDLPEPKDRELPPLPPSDLVSESTVESNLYRGFHVQHEWTWNTEDIIAFDVGSYMAHLFEAADSIGGQLANAMFEHISEVAEEHGQTINAHGRNFYDVLIEASEKMEPDFDEEGNPRPGLLAINPADAEKVFRDPPTPEQEKRMQEVIDRKREEWRASRARRKLP
ncbi:MULTISPECIES: hypothetical protein [unclassified Mycobacterium]|uniref:hypothetical protein n=1 Tax=unclassified Mycobacterium TaxID=2642494 RepID=UPI0007402AC0|nr:MULTISPECIES: hypothetical protein [unclassified Mycobacterium]KUH82204.1 hypothetical protein AU185_21140 [Mycobacterium sp. GA-0227b]KUH90060.1 hypothetical protein AU186_10280 [Mycobacterium sp. GA-1999]